MSQPIHIRPSKYGPKQARWIESNIGKISKARMAKKFGVSNESFRRVLTWLRGKGYNIPKDYSSQAEPKALGTVVCRKYTKRPDRYFRKMETGWVECTREFRKPREKKEKAPKEVKPKSLKKREIVLLPIPAPAKQVEKTRIELPGGRSIICDSDKVEATLKYIQKQKIA